MTWEYKPEPRPDVESFDEDWRPAIERGWRTEPWVPKIFREKIELKDHLKARTSYLWAMLRMAVHSKGYL
jgi:hypothetical protein